MNKWLHQNVHVLLHRDSKHYQTPFPSLEDKQGSENFLKHYGHHLC